MTVTLLDHPAAGQSIGDWLAQTADWLLNGCTLSVTGALHRLLEVEAYLNAPAWDHADPFTHGDEMQLTTRRWYFHRDGASYRGGTYKGVDITFGDAAGAYGGWLVRSLEAPDGRVVNGSCLCVESMLEACSAASVAELDERIAGRTVDDASSPLHLAPHAGSAEPRPLFATARVGLTLKRVATSPQMPEWIGRRYRFLTRPDKLPKGRAQLVVALHEAGHPADEIAAISGASTSKVAEWIGCYLDGMSQSDLAAWSGKSLDPPGLCRLLAAWRNAHAGG